MVSFTFDVSTNSPIRFFFVKPGKFYAPGAGWEDIPASDGKPLARHIITPTPFFSIGPAAQLYKAVLAADPADLVDGGICVYTADAVGNLLTRVVFQPVTYASDEYAFTTGGKFAVIRVP